MEPISREEAARQGLKRFFDGSACKRGHTAQRFVSSGGCIECTNFHNKRSRRKIKKLIREARAMKAAAVAERLSE